MSRRRSRRMSGYEGDYQYMGVEMRGSDKRIEMRGGDEAMGGISGS